MRTEKRPGANVRRGSIKDKKIGIEAASAEAALFSSGHLSIARSITVQGDMTRAVRRRVHDRIVTTRRIAHHYRGRRGAGCSIHLSWRHFTPGDIEPRTVGLPLR